RPSSRMVLAQKTTPNTANTGHSNVYAQLSAFPSRARRNCQSPSHSIPMTAATVNACHASHRGVRTNRHRDDGAAGDGAALDIQVSLAPPRHRSASRAHDAPHYRGAALGRGAPEPARLGADPGVAELARHLRAGRV